MPKFNGRVYPDITPEDRAYVHSALNMHQHEGVSPGEGTALEVADCLLESDEFDLRGDLRKYAAGQLVEVVEEWREWRARRK